MSENVSGRSSLSRMWSITCPTVQKGGTATKSVCMRRPAVSCGIFEVALERRAVGGGHLGQDLLLVALLEVLEQIGGVVGLELGDGLGEQFLGQGAEQLVAHRLVELGKRLRVEVRAQRLDQGDALVRLQKLDQVGKVGGRQGPRQLAHAGAIRRQQRVGDRPRQPGDGLCGRRGIRPVGDLVLHVLVRWARVQGTGSVRAARRYHRARRCAKLSEQRGARNDAGRAGAARLHRSPSQLLHTGP